MHSPTHFVAYTPFRICYVLSLFTHPYILYLPLLIATLNLQVFNRQCLTIKVDRLVDVSCSSSLFKLGREVLLVNAAVPLVGV